MGDGYRSRGSSGSCRSFGIRMDGSVAAWLLGMEQAEPLRQPNGRSAGTVQIINYERRLESGVQVA